MYEIQMPNRYFFGKRAGVDFKNGRATVDSAEVAKVLKELGYEVIEVKQPEKEKAPKRSAKKSGE